MYSPENIEQKMTFIGLVVMADPPRPEVRRGCGKMSHSWNSDCHDYRVIMD